MFSFFKKKNKNDNQNKKQEQIGPWCQLNNDYKVPRISLNLDLISKEEMTSYVTNALQIGYRMFDFDADNEAIEEKWN